MSNMITPDFGAPDLGTQDPGHPNHPSDVDFIDRVITAAAAPVSSSVERLLGELDTLVDAAFDQPSARADLQRRLYWLHYGRHEPSYAFRQWLASTTYRYFEAGAVVPATLIDSAAAPVASAETSGTDAFVADLATAQEDLSPLSHPLFQRCFAEDGTFEDLSVYLRHKWIIMLTFWRSLSEFGNRLQRHDIHNTALVYENVHEELGAGDSAAAHLIKHYELLQAIGVDVSWDDEPEFSETYEYINFRMFCMRHPDMAWGLGSFYSQEATSLEYTLGHYHQLRRLGVAHANAEIYHAHDEIDAEHTDEILIIVRNLIDDDEQRATMLRAQGHQMGLWHAHFDRVLEQLEAGGR